MLSYHVVGVCCEHILHSVMDFFVVLYFFVLVLLFSCSCIVLGLFVLYVILP